MDRLRGSALIEVFIFFSAVLIPVFFLIYYSPAIVSRVQDYQCKKNLEEISLGLHIFAAQHPEQSFPRSDSAEDAFSKIFVNGSLYNPSIFDDPRIPNGYPAGTPGPLFLSPSRDLTGVDFLYSQEKLSLNSDPAKIIVITKYPGTSAPDRFFALHVSGEITKEKIQPSGQFS